MRESEEAASFAIAQAKSRGLAEVGADELLLGCLQAAAQFGIVQMGEIALDLEELGLDWLRLPGAGGAKVAYSAAAVRLFDLAARIAKAEGQAKVRVDHLLAAFAGETTGLTGELKSRYGLTSAGWRERVARVGFGPPGQEADGSGLPEGRVAVRDYLTPEEAADALGIHVQTLRGYVRSGKLPALRLAGERAIRIRRTDLEAVLEPLVPQSMTTTTQD